jgi:DNA-binding Lrp family transcriptional regulator
MFDVENYSSRPKSEADELLGLQEEDFSNIIDRLDKEGIINNVHYDIQTGEQTDTGKKLRVEFINKK